MIEFTFPQAAAVLPVAFAEANYENMATTLAPYTPPSESVGQVLNPTLPPQPK